MGSIFDSGSQNTVTHQAQESRPFITIPGAEDALADYISRVRAESQRGYTAPRAISDRLASFTGDERAGMDMIRSATGGGDLDRARELFEQAALPINARQWTDPGIASSYMNPYEDSVVERLRGDMHKDRAIAEQGLRAKQIATSGFGGNGARALLARSQLVDDYTEGFASKAADLRYKGYDQAARLFGDNEARRLSALSDSSRLALSAGQNLATIPGQEIASANALLSSGSVQRAAEQERMNMEQGDFLEKRDWERSNLGWEGGALGAVPWGAVTGNVGNQWQTTSMPTPSFGHQVVGAGLAAAGTYGAYFNGATPAGQPALPPAQSYWNTSTNQARLSY